MAINISDLLSSLNQNGQTSNGQLANSLSGNNQVINPRLDTGFASRPEVTGKSVNNQITIDRPQSIGTYQPSAAYQMSQQAQLNALEQKRFKGMNVSTNNPYRAMANQYLSPEERSNLRMKAAEWEAQNGANQQKTLTDESNRATKTNFLMSALDKLQSDPNLPEGTKRVLQYMNSDPTSFVNFLNTEEGSKYGDSLMQMALSGASSATASDSSYSYNPDDYVNNLSAGNPYKPLITSGNYKTQEEFVKVLKNAADWEEEQKANSKTGNESNIDLSRQYQGVMNSYQKYLAAVKNREETPMKFTDWIRQPAQSGSLEIYNQFTNNNLKSLPAPYSSGGKSYKPNNDYSKQVWQNVDSIVRRFGSFRKAADEIIRNPNKYSDSYIVALADRNGMNTDQFMKWYDNYKKTQTIADGKKKSSNRG